MSIRTRVRSLAPKLVFPALVLAAGLFFCGSPARAQTKPCGYGTGHSCTDSGKNKDGSNSDPAPVPEPGVLLQLAAGVSGLAFVGRKGLRALRK
jgi:hypothetical protein